MYNVLRPAIVLLNHLRFPYKFSFIDLVFVLPMAVYVCLLMTEMNSDSAFVRKERAGVEYLRTLQPLLRLFSETPRDVYAALNGDRPRDDEILALRARIAQAVAAVDEIDRRLDSTLHT